MFCGETKDLQVDHLDGFEENGEPENLLWLCRSCNQLKSAVYKKAGMGRRTVQYNPGQFMSLFGPMETYRKGTMKRRAERESTASARRARGLKGRRGHESTAHYREVSRLVGRGMSLQDALREVGNPASGYKGFTVIQCGPAWSSTLDPDTLFGSPGEALDLIDSYKNPASHWSNYRDAVEVLRGETRGSPFHAARIIRSTPIARRYQYLDRMMRANPSVPTFEQYSFAVSTHEKGQYLGRGKWAEGAHDEGGAIIHATPPAKRREYAQRIADGKARRGRAAADARWD